MNSITRDPEIDRFGPWAVEINEKDPPPALFLPLLRQSEQPLFAVKIPRNVERRDARPGMNLYNYLINLYEHDFDILQRVGDRARRHTFRYDDIQYVRFGKELLKGTLHLQMSTQAFEVRFNTVSERVMRHLVTIIRERYSTTAIAIPHEQDTNLHDAELSYYFTGLLSSLTSHNRQIRVLALQPTVPVGHLEQTRARRIFYGAISKTLLESIHLTDGRELTIIDRGRTYKYGWQSIYGSSTYTVPLDRIQGVTWQTDPRNSALVTLNIHLGGGSAIAFVFLAGNPAIPIYRDFLAALADQPLFEENPVYA